MRSVRVFVKFLGVILYYVRYELLSGKKDSKAKFVRCPVCGHWMLNQYHFCPNCAWEDDGYENVEEYSKPSYVNGNLNVYEYREIAKQHGVVFRGER